MNYFFIFDNKICYEVGTKFPLFYCGEKKNEVNSSNSIINLPMIIQLVSAKPNLILNLSFLITKELVGGQYNLNKKSLFEILI